MIQLEPSGRIGADFPVSLLATTKLVGAVGIEFAGKSLSPADSVDLAPSLRPETQLIGSIL